MAGAIRRGGPRHLRDHAECPHADWILCLSLELCGHWSHPAFSCNPAMPTVSRPWTEPDRLQGEGPPATAGPHAACSSQPVAGQASNECSSGLRGLVIQCPKSPLSHNVLISPFSSYADLDEGRHCCVCSRTH
ncbi:hypothetical protein P7K49_007408 [Saguinus oedipus]|uniref:Uncharacterized protein n=1 Tax=Saguinus oedipus TaxID=9490 RepID=A0ABQ9VUY4_SAGOE|nr:hypothetical protein P7K49_007408 [Saguinus oedipus]